MKIVLALTAAVAMLGQDVPGTRAETKHLSVATSASPVVAGPGKRVSLVVDVDPKPTMHVYAPGQKGYIAITLTLEPNPALTAAKAKYPPGEKTVIESLNETQLVYSKPFRIAQDVTLRPGAGGGGPLTIKGTLRYQACDDRICYLPTNVPVSWSVTPPPAR